MFHISGDPSTGSFTTSLRTPKSTGSWFRGSPRRIEIAARSLKRSHGAACLTIEYHARKFAWIDDGAFVNPAAIVIDNGEIGEESFAIDDRASEKI